MMMMMMMMMFIVGHVPQAWASLSWFANSLTPYVISVSTQFAVL